jgi:membrane protein YqaA with SNARE-associated domain
MTKDQDLSELAAAAPRVTPPTTPVWLWPSVMLVLSAIALIGARAMPGHSRIWYFLPYSFLGNSLVPLPYDPAVVYLGPLYPLWLIIAVGVVGTVIIEFWNMELLARILSREGTRRFRGHHVTKWTVEWFAKAPFWTLVFTCVVPIIPHYPMRVLATLANYPIWKYQLSVILGRGGRYAWLAVLGFALKVPPMLLLGASLVFLGAMLWKLRQMNAEPEVPPVTATKPNEAA